MSAWTVHPLAQAPVVPWRNGGGTTREWWTWPDETAWRLRLSVADIERDGPFSAFPGVVRWFAVRSGVGVELQFLQGAEQLRVGSPPLRFDGAQPPYARLLDGSTRDLNLMTRDLDARLVENEPGKPLDASITRALITAEPGQAWIDGEALELDADTLVIFDSAPGHQASFNGHGWWVHAPALHEVRP